MEPITEVAEVEQKPLTTWKNAPKLSDLKLDYQDARPSFDTQKTQISIWLDNLFVRNKAQVDAPKGNSRIVPKLIRKQAEWRYPALSEPFLSTDDIFNVRPVTWEDREAAIQNQMVLNHQFNTQMDKTAFIDEYVRTAVDEGTVIVRVGWESEEVMEEKEVPIVEYRINPQLAPLHQHLAQMKEESPSQYETDVPEELKTAHEMSLEHDESIEPVVLGTEMKMVPRVIKNRPTVEICDYRNVVIDPSCLGDIKKARFVVYSFDSCLADLRKDKKYKNLDRINIEGNSPLSTPDHAVGTNTQNFNFNDKPRKKFVVREYWGFWDIHGDGVLQPFVAAWVGDTLVRMEESPFPDKELPFVIAQYLPVRKSSYGEPDGALLEDNQKVVGAVTRGMIDIMGKSANGQTGMRKDMLDTTNRRKFERGQDYEFNVNVDPRQGIFMHTYPEIPASAQFMLQLQNMEAESLSGVKAFTQGISGAALGDVAAGVRGALDASSKRELGILRRLSAGIIAIGRKIIAMNAEFLSDKEVIRITNDEFVTVRRDDLPGNFDLRLSISTAEEDNNKAQELAFMLQTMGNNMDQGMSQMILADIARLRKMPDLAKKIESYQPQPDPLVQKQRELEVALLEAKLDTERAQAQYYRANAALDTTKVNTEIAKQEQLQSETDLKNLDFVEQESGVHQERELQRIGEQARSQMALKKVDHQFKSQEKNKDLLKEFLLNKKS
jgi:hypothetical protein